MSESKRFFIVRDGKWTKACCRCVNPETGLYADVIILTMFGGSDCGKSEAERYCKLLNDGLAAFYGETDPVASLRLIQHATAPSPDVNDGGFHENAYQIATESLCRVDGIEIPWSSDHRESTG